MKMYLLSTDNGFHWNTSIMFNSIEEALIHFVNERIEGCDSGWDKVVVKYIKRPLPSYQSYIEVCLTISISSDFDKPLIVYIAEMTLVKPENKYGVIKL